MTQDTTAQAEIEKLLEEDVMTIRTHDWRLELNENRMGMWAIKRLLVLNRTLQADKAKLLADWRRMKDAIAYELKLCCPYQAGNEEREARRVRLNITLSPLSYTDSPTAHE